MSATVSDRELKFRLHRFLWSQGWFVRREVTLRHYPTSTNITDVDVYGVRFSLPFQKELTICDCKGGRHARSYERFLWLNGLMNFLDAKQAYFIRQELKSVTQDFGSSLNIITMDDSSLKKYESDLRISKDWWVGSFSKNLAGRITNWKSSLKRTKLKTHLRYIETRYWLQPVFLQIRNVLHYGTNISERQIADERTKWLLLENIIRFCLSTMTLTSQMWFSKQINDDIVSTELLGGVAKRKETEKRVQQWIRFFDTYTQERYGDPFAISEDEVVARLLPPYLPFLKDLVERNLNNPAAAINSLRILDFSFHEFLLNRKTPKIGELLNGMVARITPLTPDLQLALKMAQNVVATYQRCVNHKYSYLDPFQSLS